jgi:AraC-like DNA-binding protein
MSMPTAEGVDVAEVAEAAWRPDLEVAARLSRKKGLRPATATLWVEAVERAVARMRCELDQPLQLEAMADAAALSVWHFARVFHHVTGVPPAQFLATLRLAEAKRLLLTSDLSVIEICFQVGYSSPGSFTTRFTQSVGMSPRRFRQLRGMRPTGANETGALGAVVGGPEPADTVRLRGRLIGGDDRQIFLGLFTTPVPEGHPVRCQHLPNAAAFLFENVPHGTYHLLAAALPARDTFADPGAGRLQVGGAGPLELGEPRDREVVVRLRPAGVADPPILLALGSLTTDSSEDSAGVLSA